MLFFLKDLYYSVEYFDRKIFKLMSKRESMVRTLIEYDKYNNVPDVITPLRIRRKIGEINVKIGKLLKEAADTELFYSSSERYLCKQMLDAAFLQQRILIPSRINELFD